MRPGVLADMTPSRCLELALRIDTVHWDCCHCRRAVLPHHSGSTKRPMSRKQLQRAASTALATQGLVHIEKAP